LFPETLGVTTLGHRVPIAQSRFNNVDIDHHHLANNNMIVPRIVLGSTSQNHDMGPPDSIGRLGAPSIHAVGIPWMTDPGAAAVEQQLDIAPVGRPVDIKGSEAHLVVTTTTTSTSTSTTDNTTSPAAISPRPGGTRLDDKRPRMMGPPVRAPADESLIIKRGRLTPADEQLFLVLASTCGAASPGPSIVAGTGPGVVVVGDEARERRVALEEQQNLFLFKEPSKHQIAHIGVLDTISRRVGVHFFVR